jgi:hypothetical protein
VQLHWGQYRKPVYFNYIDHDYCPYHYCGGDSGVYCEALSQVQVPADQSTAADTPVIIIINKNEIYMQSNKIRTGGGGKEEEEEKK